MSSMSASVLSTTRAFGCASAACAARSGDRVRIAATARLSTAVMSGAWKTDPDSPYPAIPTRRGVVLDMDVEFSGRRLDDASPTWLGSH